MAQGDYQRAQPLHLRIFVSSPSDTADERGVALATIDRLQYDPFVRGAVTLEGVAWDRPGAATPMLANRTPQAAIETYLPRPSECDVVVVVLWARLGTAQTVPADAPEMSDLAQQSGTAWEFEDALTAARRHGRPQVMVYRRTEKVLLDDEAPDYDERLRQKRLVREFFDRFKDPRTGAAIAGYNSYETPEDFRQRFENDLRAILNRLLKSRQSSGPKDDQARVAESPPIWQGSPFPGLRAFVPADAPIFFGRGREIDALLRRLADSRFVAVVGASGSGKSSLVGAGLIPRLATGALAGSSDWLLPDCDSRTVQWSGIRFTPAELGADPFIAAAAKLGPLVGRAPRQVAGQLTRDTTSVAQLATAALSGRHTGAELLVFIDQFEELFTLVDQPFVVPFVSMLEAASQCPVLRTVVTMRSDFYHRCLEEPTLARLLERAQLPLAAPTETLVEMIARPAERAALQFEEGLIGRIYSDTQRQPGALPLLAYALDELYETSPHDGLLTHDAYERQGGVAGAIGMRAEAVFNNELDDETRATFTTVVRELLEIDEYGRATRRRAPLRRFSRDQHARRFVELFTAARLFVTSRASDMREPVVEVAHEALFESWPRLAAWVQTTAEDLRLLQRVTAAAREWEEHQRDEAYRWLHERLEPVYQMLERLRPELDDVTLAFTEPEHVRLLIDFSLAATEHYRRQAIGDRLLAIGAVTIPPLLAALQSEDASVRSAAAATLAKFGETAVPGLLEALDNATPEVRLEAAGALRISGTASAISGLVKALRDPDTRVRSQAAGALRAAADEHTLRELGALLNDADIDTRWQAVGVLGAMGSSALPRLLTALADADLGTRALAHKAVSAIGESAVEPLIAAFNRSDTSLRVQIAEAIATIGRPAVPGVLRMLAHSDLDVRARAITILGAIGDRRALTAVLDQLHDADAGIRLVAADALSNLADASAIEPLLTALDDAPPEMEWAIIDALASTGEAGAGVLVNALTARLSTEVTHAVGESLRGMGAVAAPYLVDALRSPEARVRARASAILASIGPATVPHLIDVVRQGEPAIHAAVEEVLCAMGAASVNSLVEAARDSHPRVRAVAMRALGNVGTPQAIEALVERAQDVDESVSVRALEALGHVGHESALLRAVGSASPAVRGAAQHALVRIGPGIVPELLGLLVSSDEHTGTWVVSALESIATPYALVGLNRWRAGQSGAPAQEW